MNFKNLFRKIVGDFITTQPPQIIIEAFNNQFDTPLNTEWLKSDGFYEAVFYKNELEHIAKYQENGNPISLKINLPLELIPKQISETLNPHGEIMSVIKIKCEEKQYFETIVRDQNLHRYVILVDDSGSITDKRLI
jgi:hypothetical protein